MSSYGSAYLPAFHIAPAERSHVLLPDDNEVDLFDDIGERSAMSMLCDAQPAWIDPFSD